MHSRRNRYLSLNLQISPYLRTDSNKGLEEKEDWRKNSKRSVQYYLYRICMEQLCFSQLFAFIFLSEGLWCKVSTSFLTVLLFGLAFFPLMQQSSWQKLCKEVVTMQPLKSCLPVTCLHQCCISSALLAAVVWWTRCCFHYNFHCWHQNCNIIGKNCVSVL